MLEAGQAVGEGAHVAAALDVVLPTQWVDAAAVAPDVPRQERQVDQREDVVDGVVVLGDAEGPADHRHRRRRVLVRQLADRVGRDARLALGVGQGVRLDRGGVGVEPLGGVVDELAVPETRGDDLARDRVRERDVGPDVEAEPRGRPTPRTSSGAGQR